MKNLTPQDTLFDKQADSTANNNVNLHPSWQAVVGTEFNQPYMQALKSFLLAEKGLGKIIYPKGADIFNALNSTPFDNVRVVILGQDPYHGTDNGKVQAHGLSFSVPHGVRPPPSLKNIFKELNINPQHGNLQAWAEQGVLLLNATLTVEAASAGSHQGRGWEIFTDAIIAALNNQRQNIVFMLWGSYAQKKGALIDRTKHCVLQAPHPSPLSAHRGFLGCGHFVQANAYLKQQGLSEINWEIK